MKVVARTFSGVNSSVISERELKNRAISRAAAAEGVVLLKNESLLPLKSAAKVAVFGNGIARIIKGGTGSGDVNERNVVPVVEGLNNAGFVIVNEKEALTYMEESEAARIEWRDAVNEKFEQVKMTSGMNFFTVMNETKQRKVDEIPVIESQLKDADAAIFIISRVAGEGQDRHVTKGDYLLSDDETAMIREIAKYNNNIVILINAGAQVDITDLAAMDEVKSIINISQPGLEAGNVIADVLSGVVNPSGRLTATWTKSYDDFPNAKTFSHCNGDTSLELYEEGIYVGYRYFDSFGVDVLYPFGYGLSYTTFEMVPGETTVDGNEVAVSVKVTNTGDIAGKQVVQIYVACPGVNKELKRLVGYAKTKELAPFESETVKVTFSAKDLASFDYEKSAWIAEAGKYLVFVGENVKDITLAAVLNVEAESVIEKVNHISPLKRELNEKVADEKVKAEFMASWSKATAEVSTIAYAPTKDVLPAFKTNEFMQKATEIANQMSDDELVAMVMGEITKGQDNIKENELVSTGIYVPGAAGETSCKFVDKYGIPAISMADGPAGLRLMKEYYVDNETDLIYGQGLVGALTGGFFSKKLEKDNYRTYYMFATSIPIGTMLAQTWNQALVEQIGEMVAEEMHEFKVSWWLAPGLNIHRNPLCGRNFEYYSEDPVISGTMAAAITRGVQTLPGVGTTIKHFACNNQEDNRFFSNSTVSERAMREIYLRGFEIAVKTSQPMCLMSSYNLINDVPSANSRDLMTEVLRNEWDFKGMVMSDWTTTTAGSAKTHLCPWAGNDLIMPGGEKNLSDFKEALDNGTIDRADLRLAAARVIATVFTTLGMEDPKPYNML